MLRGKNIFDGDESGKLNSSAVEKRIPVIFF
jgi:hypothetical protein